MRQLLVQKYEKKTILMPFGDKVPFNCKENSAL